MSSSQTPKRTKHDRLIGALLADKYKIEKKIGEGGMGSVYIANQRPIDRKVAVKVLLSKLAEDEVAVKRFEQEAKAISRMQHPNTVTIYDFGKTSEEDDERLYIVMEYLRGQTLTQVLRADGQLTSGRAARIMRQVCASLGDAHAAGIIHRDLKPDNIFLTEVGGDKDWVKVLDFGVAKLADSDGVGTLTQTGMIFGTPKYMSPEQAEGRPIDYRADIYALGVVLYELLVGRPPFVADTPVGLLLKHISEPPPPFSQVRPDLHIEPLIEAITMRALDKRPEGRQQMVSELAAELEAFERSVSGAVPVPGLNTMATGPAGLPTEVNPGQQAQLTPRDLLPPGQVPSGLSLGEFDKPTGQRTGPVGPPTSETAHPGTSQDMGPGASRLMTAQGITYPTPAHGGGIETLGGISGEISGGRPGRPSSSSVTMVAGALLLLAALGLGGYVFLKKPSDSVQAEPMIKAGPGESPDPTALAAPPPAVPPPSEPAPAVAPPPDASPPDESPAVAPPPPTKDRSPRPQPVRAAPPPPPKPSALVTVRFDSTPAGAKVVLLPSGKQLGFTPFSTQLPRHDLVNVAFSKRGFKPVERTFSTENDRTIRSELAKRAVRPRCADGSAPPCSPPPPPPPAKRPPKTDPDKVIDLKVDDLKGF